MMEPRVAVNATQAVWKAIDTVCRNRRLKVSIQETFNGALVAGLGALVGGLLGGRAGIFLGGALGGVVGAGMGPSQSVLEIILSLTEREKSELLADINTAAGNMASLDGLASMILSSNSLQDIVINLVSERLQNHNMMLA